MLPTIVWPFGSLIGAVGVAMQVRWAFAGTENGQARVTGMVRAAAVELIGLVLILMSARGQSLIAALVIMMVGGFLVGFAAARALRPPP